MPFWLFYSKEQNSWNIFRNTFLFRNIPKRTRPEFSNLWFWFHKTNLEAEPNPMPTPKPQLKPFIPSFGLFSLSVSGMVLNVSG